MERIDDRPFLSVITVCYNAVADIENTLKSVLGQSAAGSMEVIVIDGASTDGTVSIVNKYQSRLAKFISEPDKGIYNAMNKGIDLSRGQYVLFMNAGDLFFNRDVVKDIMAEIEEMNERPDVVYGATVFRYPDGYEGARPDLSLLPAHMGGCHQSILVDGDMIRRLKFDESYRISADFDLIHRLYQTGARFATVGKYISIYNFDGVSASWKGQLRGVKERRRITGRSTSQLLCYLDVIRTAIGKWRRSFTGKSKNGISTRVPLRDIAQL